MDILTKSITQHSGEVIIFLLILTLCALGVALQTRYQVRSLNRKLRGLLEGKSNGDLENILLDHVAARQRLEADSQRLAVRVADLERLIRTSKRHVGVVKYDAFDDVGGQQSFALAIYDDRGDGMVVTSIVGRTDCRVYAKPLVGLASDRTLSQEERRAIRDAKADAVRTVVSP